MSEPRDTARLVRFYDGPTARLIRRKLDEQRTDARFIDAREGLGRLLRLACHEMRYQAGARRSRINWREGGNLDVWRDRLATAIWNETREPVLRESGPVLRRWEWVEFWRRDLCLEF